MLIGLLRQLAKLPLSWTHAVGGALGWMVYFFSPTYSARLRANLLESGLWRDEKDYQRILHRNIAESGKAGTELIPVWFRPVASARQLVIRAGPIELLEQAERRGKGVIYLTPHLGCFDIIPLWVAQRYPITVLYRPPKMQSLQPLIEAGRGRDRVRLAPATLGGVRLLLKALRRGEGVGILPDQVPGGGDGAWADFFGRPAYTMTLLGKLVEATGATVVLTAALRLPDGAGYAIHFMESDGNIGGDGGTRALNTAIERLIKLEPSQYLWSYNRYKGPSGAKAPDGRDAHAKPASGHKGRGARGEG